MLATLLRISYPRVAMSSTEAEPRIITPDSLMDERYPDYMTVGEYMGNVKRSYQRMGALTVEAVFEQMSDIDAISAAIQHGADTPEVLAFKISEMMKGDTEKTQALNWGYLRMYQRHWSYVAGFNEPVSIDLLEYADRFAASTGQTSIHAPILEDGDSINWSGSHFRLNLASESIFREEEDPSYVSLILSCDSKHLKEATRVLGGSIGVATVFNYFEYNIEAVPIDQVQVSW